MASKKAAMTAAAVALVAAAITVLGPDPAPEGPPAHRSSQDTVARSFGVFETAETQTLEFQVAPAERDGFGPLGALEDELETARRRLEPHRPGGFAVKVQGDEFGPDRQLVDALEVFGNKLQRSPVGTVVIIRAASDGYRETGRSQDINPLALADTTGIHAIDLLAGTVADRFPDVTSLGALVCKKISGTDVWSQHAFGRAQDFGGPGPWGSDQNIALLDDVVAYVNRLAGDGYFDINHILWRGVDNHFPGHVHVDLLPAGTGTPECAR